MNKMAVYIYTYQNFFKCKWTECPDQKTELLNGFKKQTNKQTHLFTEYRKLITEVWIHTHTHIFHVTGNEKES